MCNHLEMMKLFMVALIFACIKTSAEEFKCPDKIETKQIFAGEIGSDWQSIEDTINGQKTLEDMHVYNGNPNNVGSTLAPDNKGSKQDPYWTVTASKEIWLSCRYSQTTIRLVKAIPSRLKRCTLKYKQSSGYVKKKIVDSLICK